MVATRRYRHRESVAQRPLIGSSVSPSAACARTSPATGGRALNNAEYQCSRSRVCDRWSRHRSISACRGAGRGDRGSRRPQPGLLRRGRHRLHGHRQGPSGDPSRSSNPGQPPRRLGPPALLRQKAGACRCRLNSRPTPRPSGSGPCRTTGTTGDAPVPDVGGGSDTPRKNRPRSECSLIGTSGYLSAAVADVLGRMVML